MGRLSSSAPRTCWKRWTGTPCESNSPEERSARSCLRSAFRTIGEGSGSSFPARTGSSSNVPHTPRRYFGISGTGGWSLSESLLDFVLTRLDQVESPVFLHRELERFPPEQLKAQLSEGLLRETSRATEIPRPVHIPGGGDLIVCQTAKGLFCVADEDDYFDPIPLTDDDVRQYEVSLPKLAA